MMSGELAFSIVVPAYNEEDAITATVDEITRHVPQDRDYEIIVVNDGSTDKTAERLEGILSDHSNLRMLEHTRNRGYGAALKTGIREARSEYIVITDADGTYPNERIPALVDLCHDQDMVVASRTGAGVVYSKIRAIPKFFLKRWVSWLAGRDVPDINSGLRVFRKDVAEEFFGILPNSFSFTITITLSLLTTYRRVKFVPIPYHPRVGKSKIKPVRDTLRFIKLILRTGVYFAPLRAFAPIIAMLMTLAICSLGYDVFILRNLTDKTVILFLFSLNFGMFALLADMIDKRIG